MRPRVYIETTIPSLYFETRAEHVMAARREWTRQWWDGERHGYDLFTGISVIEELERWPKPEKDRAVALVAGLPLLPVNVDVEEAVDAYVANKVMPSNPRGDALHLALASYHRCHFLLTWNCAHLANANKFEHIRHVNVLLGLHTPAIITPVELLNWEGQP
jgi:hypothetical protein